MIDRLSAQGVLLLSGLLIQDEEQLVNSIKQRGLDPIEKLAEGEWTAVAARRIG